MRNLYLEYLLLSLVLITPSASIAGDGEVCAPFKDGVVDESVVAEMLAAASDGHLYRIRPASSRVGFCVDSPVGVVRGEFKTFQGGLTMQAVADKGRVMVRVDTASLETGGAFVESLLKSERFFDVDSYPEIVFVSTGFEWVSKREAVLIGDLTMRGVTRKVGFHVKLVESEATDEAGLQKIIVSASTSIRRSEFGIVSMRTMVSDTVTLCMSVDAEKVKV